MSWGQTIIHGLVVRVTRPVFCGTTLMLSPPLTFILVLVALSCTALEKVHACPNPNPYTNLASPFELWLSRRTLTESEIREKCKELCEMTYPHLVILYEVGAHLMGECINQCVSSSNDLNHPWHPFITASGAAALASSHDDNLHSPSPPRSHSPVAHGGASTPPPPHGDRASLPVLPNPVPLPESILKDTAERCKAWCTFADRRRRIKLHGLCESVCLDDPPIMKLDEMTRSKAPPQQEDVQQPKEFIDYCIDTCDLYLYPPSTCTPRCIASTELRTEWEKQKKHKAAGPEFSAKLVNLHLDNCRKKKSRFDHVQKATLMACGTILDHQQNR